MPDYKDIRFLESTRNIQEILSRNSGRELSLERANQIAVCLEQGRLCFESAQNMSWEIKPLIIYYGMVGFSKAISLARTFSKLESLPHRHGMTDISAHETIEQSTVRIEQSGTFQCLNDACSGLEGIILHQTDRTTTRLRKPTATSTALQGKDITLKEILARTPGLEYLYAKTFNDGSKVTNCSHFSCDDTDDGVIEFHAHDCKPFKNLDELQLSVGELREKYPFLKNWRLRYAALGSSLQFANLAIENADEFSALELRSGAFYLDIRTTIRAGVVIEQNPPFKFHAEDLANYCQPVRGNLTRGIETYLIEDWNGLYLSEIFLYFLGMFLLSSLVRYRPDLWANAIARRSFVGKPLDDHALALIQEFIDLSLSVFPEATVIAINEPFA